VATLTLADELRALAEWLRDASDCIDLEQVQENLRALAAKVEGRVTVEPDVHYAEEDDEFGASVYVRGHWMCSGYHPTRPAAVAALQALLDGERP
jgi:hypothetical protein